MFNLVQADPAWLGQLWLTSLTPLHVTTGTTISVPVNIYLWAEDVKLTSPTQYNINGLVPQAGEFSDEHASGPISRPAAIVEKIAGALTSVPAIRPFAMASQIGAQAVGNLARQFGYCKPRYVGDTQNFRLIQTGDLAVTDSQDNSTSLAFTAKQEVTIDPRVAGLPPQDEMDIQEMCKRESFIAAAPWTFSDSINKVLFSCPVTPNLGSYSARVLPPTAPGLALPPMGWAVLPFRYWRGKIRFRFQIVASNFHKGRLLFVWEPISTAAIPEPQVVTSRIVDIAEEKDFSIDIGWGVDPPGLWVGPARTATTWKIGTTAPAAPESNGILTVYVVNKLIAPDNTTAPVYVNVWVSAPEMEVWGTQWSELKNFSYLEQDPAPGAVESDLELQSGVMLTDGFSEGVVNAPTGAPVIDYMAGRSSAEMASTFLHGDPVKSIRTLLKRFCYDRSVAFQGVRPALASQWSIANFTGSIYPEMRGDTKTKYNAMTYLSWYSPCYAGFRGGRRWKIYPMGISSQFPPLIYVERENDIAINEQAVIQFPNTPVADLPFALQDFHQSPNGSAVTCQTMSNILEFEVPWYSKTRFFSPLQGQAFDSAQLGWRVNMLTTNSQSFIEDTVAMQVYSAVADDFSLFMFRGVPMVWNVPIPT
jgi:hypothetical protein